MIPPMTRPTLFEQLLRGVGWLLPQGESAERRTAWLDPDASWRASSFELAQGLHVIEHFDRSPGTFADTLPAFHEPASATLA
jgi:hypothetical protein